MPKGSTVRYLSHICLFEAGGFVELHLDEHALPDSVASTRCWTNVPADRISTIGPEYMKIT